LYCLFENAILLKKGNNWLGSKFRLNKVEVQNMSKKIFVILIILIIVVLGAYFGYYYYKNYYLPSTIRLPPPLANIEFPLVQVQYPPDWPNELKLPQDFILTDFASGILPEASTKGWSAKYRYQGKPAEANRIISAYFESKGWIIIENYKLDSGGFSLLIQRNQGDGIIVIDTDPNNSLQTLIITTLFP
jgi:hypothetical protein